MPLNKETKPNQIFQMLYIRNGEKTCESVTDVPVSILQMQYLPFLFFLSYMATKQDHL